MTTFAIAARVTWPDGTSRDAEVFARDGRLHVDGAKVALVYAYATERVAEPHEPNTVRVVGDGLATLLDVALATTHLAEELLVALGVDELERPVTLRAGRRGIDPFVGLLGPLVAIVPAVVLAMATGQMWLFYVVMAASVGGAVWIARRKRTVSVDASGLTVRGVLLTRRFAWEQIAEVERTGNGLHLRLRPTAAHKNPPDAFELQGLDPAGREGLYFLLVRRRALANRAAETPPPSGAPSLPPAPAPPPAPPAPVTVHDGAAWLDAMVASVPRAGYRDASPTDEDLRAAARDVDLPPGARIASAVLLARRGGRPPPVHLRDDAAPEHRALVADVNRAVGAERDLDVAVEAVRRFLSRTG